MEKKSYLKKSRTSLESLCDAKNAFAHKQKPLCDSKRTTLTAPLHKLEAQDCAEGCVHNRCAQPRLPVAPDALHTCFAHEAQIARAQPTRTTHAHNLAHNPRAQPVRTSPAHKHCARTTQACVHKGFLFHKKQ